MSFSGKIYTADKNFTRLPVATVATNSKSGSKVSHLANVAYVIFSSSDFIGQISTCESLFLQSRNTSRVRRRRSRGVKRCQLDGGEAEVGERGVGCQREKDTTSVKSFGNSNLKVNRYPSIST